MRARYSGAVRLLRHLLPALAGAALAALVTGAYSVDAARTSVPRRPLRPAFTLTASPSKATLAPGATVRVKLTIRRHRLPGALAFKLVSKAPPGAAISFSRRVTKGRSVTLRVRTSGLIAPRTYQLRIRARGGGVTRTTTVRLIIAASSPARVPSSTMPPFTVAGTPAGALQPGISQPIDLRITNPNAIALEVTDLTASVSSIAAPNSSAWLPCSAGDFAVAQYSGPLPLVIPASSAASLSQLGVSPSQWPQVTILNLPTNQDGCQGATLTLSYGATARTG